MGGGSSHAHTALMRDDGVENLDDACARGLLFVLMVGGVGLLLAGEPHNAPSESAPPTCSRGLRWPRRDVSGYWHRRCLFAHWLEIVCLRFSRLFKINRFEDASRRRARARKGVVKG
jgi:hypothetical protein